MNKFEEISYETINLFLNKIESKKSFSNELLKDMAKFADENNVPIIKKDVQSFLELFLGIIKPRNILEIGTAIGFSSYLMALSTNYSSQILTIERDEEVAEIAKNFLSKDDKAKIDIVIGDALEEIKKLDDKKYSLVFIDAAKSKYKEFFELIKPKVKDDVVIICDNILFKGMVCESFQNVPKKNRTIYKNLKMFIDEINNDNKLISSLIPIGDGLLLIRYKK